MVDMMEIPTKVTDLLDRIGAAVGRKSWLLTNPWFLILVIFLVFGFDKMTRDVLALGEVEAMLYAKQFAIPDFISGDWYLNINQEVRRPFHVLVYPLVKYLPLVAATLIARWVTCLALAVGLGLILWRLQIGVGSTIAIIWFFYDQGQSLPPGTEWFLRLIEAKAVAYAFLFFAIYALGRGRLKLMGVLAGLATLFHVLVGGWGSVALGLTVLTRGTGTWKERFLALGLWVATCSYVLVAAVRGLMAEVPGLTYDPTWIYVFFRNHRHLVPSGFEFDTEEIIFILIAGWVLLRVGKFWKGSPMAKTVAQVALWTLLPYGLGLLASLSTHGAPFLKLYPFRVGSSLFLLLGTILTIPVLLRTFLTPFGRRLLLIGVAYLALSDAWLDFNRGLDDLKRFPMGAKVRSSVSSTRRLHRACNWIRTSTPRDALILAPITEEAINYLAERPVVVTFRQVPSAPEDVHEWFTRLVAFNRGKVPVRKNYAAAREIRSNFERMSESEFRQLALKYGASYLLFRQRRELLLPLRYENSEWAVYDLRPESQ